MSYTTLIMLTIIGWGIGSACYKVANDNIHPFMVSIIVTLIFMVIDPFIFFFIKFPKTVNSTGIIFSVVGGLLMGIGSIAYFFAIKKGSAGEVTTITALYPALTLIISIAFLHEEMSFKKGIGIALALASFIILSQK